MGSIFLTAVYPTATTGAHENNGGKSAGKDVFPSGKGVEMYGKTVKSSISATGTFLVSIQE